MRNYVGWLGAASWASSMFAAPIIIALCRRKSTRLTAVIGGLVLALGILFTSFATLLHQVAFSYGKRNENLFMYFMYVFQFYEETFRFIFFVDINYWKKALQSVWCLQHIKFSMLGIRFFFNSEICWVLLFFF